MRRQTRLKPWQSAVVAVALFLALLWAAASIASNHLEGVLLRTIEARTARQVRVDGSFEAHLLSRHPSLTATKVWISNPPWMPAGTFATIGKVAVALEWQVSSSLLRIRRLELDHTKLRLVLDTKNRANWYRNEHGPGEGPPVIRSLSMRDAQVELQDERRDLRFSGIVSAADVSSTHAQPPPLRVEGAGVLNGRTVSFTIEGDPLADTQRGQPYHFKLEERSGAARLNAQGFLRHALDFRQMQATFELSGPDLIDLDYLVGLRLLHTGEFNLSGKLIRDGERFDYQHLAGTSGRTDVSGEMSVDSSRERPRVEGQLSSQVLRLADFGARVAGDKSEETQKTSAFRVPDTPLRLTGLRHTEMKVRVSARAVELGRDALHAVAARITTDHGKLTVEDFTAALADGTLTGRAGFDTSGGTPRGDVDLSVAGLRLEALGGENGAGDAPFMGAISGRMQLNGRGQSLHELAATANGTLTAVIPHGEMRASLAQATDLDLSAALGLARKSGKRSGVRCGVASFEAHDGVFTAQTLVIDTDKVLISGQGALHMDSESLDFAVHGRPKHPEIALHEGIALRGTLTHPEVRLTGHGALAQVGAAVTLGALLTPLAAALAFVNPGLAHDADCDALLDEAPVAAGAPP